LSDPSEKVILPSTKSSEKKHFYDWIIKFCISVFLLQFIGPIKFTFMNAYFWYF
jgi:hypothetical protein